MFPFDSNINLISHKKCQEAQTLIFGLGSDTTGKGTIDDGRGKRINYKEIDKK